MIVGTDGSLRSDKLVTCDELANDAGGAKRKALISVSDKSNLDILAKVCIVSSVMVST